MDNTQEQLNKLVGEVIQQAYINSAKDEIILAAESGKVFHISHPYECCEYVWFCHINQSEFLMDSPITSVVIPKWIYVEAKPVSENYYVCQFGIQINTLKGTTTFETRLESNGCYGGDLCLEEIDSIPVGFINFNLLSLE